jgi:uncharacterized membrane protein
MSDVDRSVRRRRWIAAAFVVSLALNAFFLGGAATEFLFRGHHDGRGRPPRMLEFEMRWLAELLPPDGFRRVADAVAASRPESERHMDRLRQLRRELGGLAAAPQPDRAAIDVELAAIRSELDQMLAAVQKTTIDSLLTLPPEMRSRLAEARDSRPGPDGPPRD